MSLLHEHIQMNDHVDPRSTPVVRLRRRWHMAARIAWIVLVAFTVGVFLVGIAVYYPQLSNPQISTDSRLLHPDSSVSGYVAFNSNLATPLGGYTLLNIAIPSFASLLWVSVGSILFWRTWRRPDEGMALFAALMLVLFGIAFSPILSMISLLAEIHSPWRWLITIVQVLGYSSIACFLFLFPDGRFVPRWTRWAAILTIAYQIPFIVPSNTPFSIEQWPPLLFALAESSCMFAFSFAQIYRYRRISGLIQQQQTKWVVFGMVITLVGFAGLFLPPLVFPSLTQPGLPQSLYAVISRVLSLAVLLMIPLSIGFAMLHYRLWDIDILINRTIVYGTLSVVLALLYFGCVVLLQHIFQTISGQGSTLAIVGSTLFIVGLIQPLRQGIQIFIDRRFYRRKYDAARIVAAFSMKLQNREEVDVTILTDDLLKIVAETMQPAHVSLWLCRTGNRENKRVTQLLPKLDD